MTDKIERLKSFDDLKLIDIVKNYRQYGYDDSLRDSVIEILKSRGIQESDLKLTGNFNNRKYDYAIDIAKSYSKNSKLTFCFYGLFLVTKILTLAIAQKTEFSGWIFFVVNILSLILFFTFLIKSFINHNDFYRTIGKELGAGDQFVYFIVGMPLYVFLFFYYRSQMQEEMKLIR